MTPQLISPPAFVARMTDYWSTDLGNVSSDPLRAAWLQMAAAFGRHILAHEDPNSATTWSILQAPTGAGKSQGTAVYCGMLADYATPAEHPGVLIVTRRIEDANDMAATIGRLAGREGYARAYHSEVAGPGVLEALKNFPVLVITHRAYELALDRLGSEGSITQTWPYFHSWGGLYTRRLVVIDEALDIVEESQGELAGLRMTLASIPDPVRKLHAGPVAAVKAVVELLERMEESPAGGNTAEAILLQKAIEQGTVPDITGLRVAMRSVRFDHQLRKNDEELNRGQWKVHDDRLRQLDHIFRSWVYYAKLPRFGHTLNTARLLVPDDVKGAVVLDATATANLVYELFDKASVEQAPAGVRSYRNVTLHVSRGHKVGKVAMRNAKEEGDQLLRAVVGDLSTRIAGRSAFFISHQETEPRIVTATAGCPFTTHTGHWNAVTGSNSWRDCDVAVVVGLPYRPDTWTANTFMALQGVQSTEWLRAQERPYGSHKDIRGAIKRGQVVADVVQAINRIRCRKVIDAEGNCPTADVFLLLPQGPEGDLILEGITCLMDGVQVRDWHIADAPQPKKRGRKAGGGQVQAMVAAAHMWLKARMPGKTSKAELVSALGLTPKAWDAVVASSGELLRFGITYEVEQTGKTRRATFHKR